MSDEIIEAEATHVSAVGDVAMVPVNLFGAANAVAVIDAATRLAQPLARIIEEQRLFTDIRGRRHVRVEGWTLLGSMLGVFPVVCWTRPLDGGWEARVEARTRDGAVVGAAEAECLRGETTWRDRDDYALRSMAQTRATSKALRLPLGFVIQLAGFETTPAEEMPAEDTPAGPPCPHCGAPVVFNEERTRGKKPAWSCQNRGCGGGSPRKEGGGNWPWGSYDPDFFANQETGGPLEVVGPSGEAPAVVGGFDVPPVEKPLAGFGIDEQMAREELAAAARNPAFASGTVAKIRAKVERAVGLMRALDGDAADVAELWVEWRRENPGTTGWHGAHAAEVLGFAKHVQLWLRASEV